MWCVVSRDSPSCPHVRTPMPPRKSTQSPSVAREEAPKKKAKYSHSPSLTPTTTTNSSNAHLVDFRLTADEKQFLATQLAQLSGHSAADKSAPPTADLSSSTWTNTLLPVIVAITEKVLKVAAEQFAVASSAAAAHSATEAEEASPAAPNPAGTPQQFLEENEYLLDQLRQHQWVPFTYQRLLEILADPCTACGCLRSSSSASPGAGKWNVRGDVLQAAIRRCLLVTYPFTGEGDRTTV